MEEMGGGYRYWRVAVPRLVKRKDANIQVGVMREQCR